MLAALVASIVLSLGMSIFGIAQKELTLSSIGRDSQFAFYAADTASECALYWDFRCNYFATSTALINPACNDPKPTCDQQPLNATGRASTYPYTMTSAQMGLFQDTSQGGYCAQVFVEKCDGPIAADGTCTPATPPVVHTLIRANGYSVPCSAITTSSHALQRTVELHY